MVDKERRFKVVVINEEFLSIMLQLPEGMRIERVSFNDLIGRLGIVVSHPSFAAVDDGGEIPTLVLAASEENGRWRRWIAGGWGRWRCCMGRTGGSIGC